MGINTSSVDYYGMQFPFADLMKNSMGWVSMSGTGAWGSAALFPSMTADGYPAV